MRERPREPAPVGDSHTPSNRVSQPVRTPGGPQVGLQAARGVECDPTNFSRTPQLGPALEPQFRSDVKRNLGGVLVPGND